MPTIHGIKAMVLYRSGVLEKNKGGRGRGRGRGGGGVRERGGFEERKDWPCVGAINFK